MNVFWIVFFLSFVLEGTYGGDVGCLGSTSGSSQAVGCTQRGCCEWNNHITSSGLCDGQDEVCCYSSILPGCAAPPPPDPDLPGADVGCLGSTSGSNQAVGCTQRGCCEWDLHVTSSSLCSGQDQVCCYSSILPGCATEPGPGPDPPGEEDHEACRAMTNEAGDSGVGCTTPDCCAFSYFVTNPSVCSGAGSVCCFSNIICGGPADGSEFRAAWVSTVWNIDYPSSSSQSTSASQSEMRQLVQNFRNWNFNAIIFQVRPAGDAMYPSSLEPWSEFLTGSQGRAPSPSWDPLQFLINEARQYGIEVHAWLNPYRASIRTSTSGLASNNMCMRWRSKCYSYGSTLWMDPGYGPVQDHLENVVLDIVRRYDVDGIHLDDYFYPYPSGAEFPDQSTYNDYRNSGGSLGRDDWRRDNNNRMVERLFNSIKATKSNVKFSISPFGIYRPCQPGGQPCSISGLDQYSAIYADPKLWLQRGWTDFQAPQLYWSINSNGQSFPVLLDWWTSPDVNPMGRHIYTGIGAYQLEQSGWPVSELTRQVEITRESQYPNSYGNIMFSYDMFKRNVKGVQSTFSSGLYSSRSAIPSMPYLR